jgi:hypothetical protein
MTVVVKGEEYERTVERVVDLRAPLTPRLSPNSGYPTIAVPAGFASRVYDRAVVRGPDGSKRAGEFLPPKAVELPVGSGCASARLLANLRHTVGNSWVGGAPRVPHNIRSGIPICRSLSAVSISKSMVSSSW